MRAAVIQIRGNQGLLGNLDAAAHWLAKASAEGAQLAVLPENFAYYGQKNLAHTAASEVARDGTARAFLAAQAKAHGLWLVGGTIPVTDAGANKPYAASFLINKEGEDVARYNKIHLFDVDVADTGRRYRESDDYRHGEQVVVANSPWGGLGLSVCYDLRFPELYRQQVQKGARILTAPSAFTAATGSAHWQLLLRARAVENLCFMLAANLADRTHPKTPTWGGSAIIDPWGRVLAELDDEEGFAIADLDFEAQDKMRANMPVLAHRRVG
jgi:nitrilase